MFVMNPKPPPIPPKSSPPPIPTSQNAEREEHGYNNWIIYTLAASMVFVAAILLLVAVRVKQDSGQSTAESTSAPTNKGQVQDGASDQAQGNESSGDSSPSVDQANDPESPPEGEAKTTEQKPTSPNEVPNEAKPLETDTSPQPTPESDSSQFQSKGTTDDSAAINQIPALPVVQVGRAINAGALATESGKNPFTSSLDAASIAFVIDRSSSMDGNKLRRVVAALIETIEYLREDQKFLVIFFDDNLQVHPSMKGLL